LLLSSSVISVFSVVKFLISFSFFSLLSLFSVVKFFFLVLSVVPCVVYGEVGFCPPWGKDADLQIVEATPQKTVSKASLMARFADKAILFHQNVISPVDGPRSHFRPTSSRYMQLAIQRNGFMKGFIMGCDRLLRENSDPWVYPTIEIDGSPYKWDPVRK
jgi:putative component of membrane protein insertase Oxa1/YidC/SpoIIIJ protein YidD